MITTLHNKWEGERPKSIQKWVICYVEVDIGQSTVNIYIHIPFFLYI